MKKFILFGSVMCFCILIFGLYEIQIHEPTPPSVEEIEQLTNSIVYDQLKQDIEHIKGETKFPVYQNQFAYLKSITLDPKDPVVTYEYIIHTIPKEAAEDAFTEDDHKSISSILCADESQVLQKGAIIIYQYKYDDGSVLKESKFSKDDCYINT